MRADRGERGRWSKVAPGTRILRAGLPCALPGEPPKSTSDSHPPPPSAHFPLLALQSPVHLPRLPFRQLPSGISRYILRDASKSCPASPRGWTDPREFLHQPPLAPSHAVDRFHGRWASQRSPRGVPSARSAGGVRYGGRRSCLTGPPPAIAELVSRMCSSPAMVTAQV